MNVVFHPEAREELRQAAEWYDDRSPGLGEELVAAVERAIEVVREGPDRWPVYPTGKRTRRFLLRRFPFSVNDVVVGNVLFIAAVAHLSRSPGYWGKRMMDTRPAD